MSKFDSIFFKHVNPLTTQTAINHFIPLMNNMQQNQNSEQIDFNKIKMLPLYNYCKNVKTNNENFFRICNDIIKNVFDNLKIDANITFYNKTFTIKAGNIKVTINATSGGKFSFDKEQYIFKNSEYIKTEGFFMYLIDKFLGNSGGFMIPQIRNNIEMFKQKVGKSIINGSVAMKIEFFKLIYEFDIAKNDDLSELYGTLTITLELDFDLNKIGERIGQEIMKSLGIIKITLDENQLKIIGAAIIGVLFIVFGIAAIGLLIA